MEVGELEPAEAEVEAETGVAWWERRRLGFTGEERAWA